MPSTMLSREIIFVSIIVHDSVTRARDIASNKGGEFQRQMKTWLVKRLFLEIGESFS